MNQYLYYQKKIRPEKKIVANELIREDFKTVLEIGCQWGENLKAIEEEIPDVKLTGIDIDFDTITQTKNQFPEMDIICLNGLDKNFLDKSFDVVFLQAVMCMIKPEEVEKMLDNAIRMAKKLLILVELELDYTSKVPFNIDGSIDNDGRTGANWLELIRSRRLKAERRKILEEEWSAFPWTKYGYVYKVRL